MNVGGLAILVLVGVLALGVLVWGVSRLLTGKGR